MNRLRRVESRARFCFSKVSARTQYPLHRRNLTGIAGWHVGYPLPRSIKTQNSSEQWSVTPRARVAIALQKGCKISSACIATPARSVLICSSLSTEKRSKFGTALAEVRYPRLQQTCDVWAARRPHPPPPNFTVTWFEQFPVPATHTL